MALGLLGSSATLGIGLSVYLDDQFTQASSNIHNTLALMGKDVDDFSQGMARIESIGEGLARFGDKVRDFAMGTSQDFATFEHSINQTRVLAGIEKTDKGYGQLTETAKKLSEIYGTLPDVIGNAEFQLAKGGKSTSEIIKMTEAVVALGAATQTQIDGPSGTATGLLNMLQVYNANADQALHYSDIITSATHHSALQVNDFLDAMRYASSYAAALHISFEETATTIAALGKAGIRGSMGGTSYANMLRFMETGIGIFATKKQTTALGLLGLNKQQMTDDEGHLIKMGALIKLLKERTRGFSDNDKVSVLGGIFGVRGDKSLLALLNNTDTDSKGNLIDSYSAIQDKIHADTQNDITRQTALKNLQDQQGQVNKMKAAWQVMKIDIGATISPLVIRLSHVITYIVDKFSELASSRVGGWLIKWALILGTTMGPIGRLIALGARFAGYIVTSSGKLTQSFAMAEVASVKIREQLQIGAAAIMASAKAMGAQSLVSQFGMFNGRYRDLKTGRFVGKEAVVGEAENFAASGKGLGFIERWFMPLIEGSEWIMKTVGIVKIFGSVLGKALGWLFGWEGMLIDLGVTLLTGKSMFEWLWDGFRTLFGWIFGWPDKAANGKVDTSHGHSNKPKVYDMKMDEERYYEKKFDKEHPLKQTFPSVVYHFHIAANNSGRTIEKKIEVNHERELQSHSLL